MVLSADNVEVPANSLLVHGTRRRLLASLSASAVVGVFMGLRTEAGTAKRRRKGTRKHNKRVPRLVTARVTFTGSQSVPSDTQSLVQFNEIDYDTNPSSFNLTTSQLTVPYSGTYTVNVQVAWKGTASGQRKILLVKNNTTVVVIGAGIPAHESILSVANTTVNLRRGETLVVDGLQDSGTPVEIFSAVLSLVLVKR
jgi:hypothetical protein